MKKIMIFKTSVSNETDIQQLGPLLDQLINENEKWNFDLEDCDNILRVEAEQTSGLVIEKTLRKEGFYCEDLKD